MQYDIKELLSGAIQPFDAADEQWIKIVAKQVKAGAGLPSPVTLTSDGILIDGSQRLTAMLRAGRKVVAGDDIHVIAEADRYNALDYAIMLNANRRQLTVEQKADMARQLQRDRGWSQRRIADAFGVSRPAVSQWLKKVPDPEPSSAPLKVTGKDGKRYPVTQDPSGQADAAVPGREPVNPWHPSKGSAAKATAAAVRSLRRSADIDPAALSALQKASLEQSLTDLIAEAGRALSALTAGAGGTGPEHPRQGLGPVAVAACS